MKKNFTMLPQIIIQALNKIEKENFQARIVGGFVRNFLQQIHVFDVDIATTAKPEEIVKIFQDKKLNLKGIEHGTVCFYENGYSIEITTLRKDIKCDGRHAMVEFGSDFLEDANRRDFTINAIYMDKDCKIYDYHNGVFDLKAKRIKFIGNPSIRIQEDYLRILRYLRFSAYMSAEVDTQYVNDIQKNLHGLQHLSHERIRLELEKISQQNNSTYYFQKLQEFKILTTLLEKNVDILSNTNTENFISKLDEVKSEDKYVMQMIFFSQDFNLDKFALKRKEKSLIHFLQINQHLLTINTPNYEDIILHISKPLWLKYSFILNSNVKNKTDLDAFVNFYNNIKLPDVAKIAQEMQKKKKNLANLQLRVYKIFSQHKFKIDTDAILSTLLNSE